MNSELLFSLGAAWSIVASIVILIYGASAIFLDEPKKTKIKPLKHIKTNSRKDIVRKINKKRKTKRRV